MSVKKLSERLTAFIIVTIIICSATLNCAALGISGLFMPMAVGYGNDWRCWSQGSSAYSAMSSGCRVVSYSKLLAECGIVSADSFNPDTLFEWGCDNGYWSESSVSEKGTAGKAPVNYALSKGKTLVREGTAALSGTLAQQADIIMSYLNRGYFVIATCSAHYVYVGRAASIAAGTPIVMNSGSRASDSTSLIQQYVSPPSGWDYDYTGILYYSCSSAPDTETNSAIEFGSYPQSEVTDSAMLSQLNALSLNWISYGYYSGNGAVGSMEQGDYMKYADASLDGKKYRAVTFSAVRPAYTPSPCGYAHSGGYAANKVYWFKYEPLNWQTDNESGVMLCENVIDAQCYNNLAYGVTVFYGDEGRTSYANNYSASSVRQWLNGDFYNTAFSTEEKLSISETALVNTALNSEYSCEATADKVYLLSYYDETQKNASGSDYAKIQGFTDGKILLRTPGELSDTVCLTDGTARTYDTCVGIRPAISIPALPASEVIIDSEYNNIELAIGETALLSCKVAPASAKGYTVEYACADTSVAVVDASTGTVTAAGKGETVITVTVHNSNGSVVTDTVSVRVTEPDALSILSLFARIISAAGRFLLILLDIFT